MKLLARSAKDRCLGTELSGEAKAKVGGIVGKLADLGIEGAAKYQSGHSAGVLQKDLITAILSGNNCRLQVFQTLERDLLRKAPLGDEHGVITKNAQDMRLEDAIIGTWRYSTKPPPSTGLADCKLFTTFQRDHIANQRGSCIYQGQRFPGEASGKWSITDGVLRCRLESSNFAFQFQLKEGFTWEGKIISIRNDKLRTDKGTCLFVSSDRLQARTDGPASLPCTSLRSKGS